MITKINMINYEDKGGPQMSRLIEMIETAETIAVLGHIHPDGDCVGSCLAVCNYIREQYPEKVVQVYLEKPPVKFNYLKYFDEICQDAHTGKTYASVSTVRRLIVWVSLRHILTVHRRASVSITM